ncbi:abortive infection family protein [Actinomyces gaoshouyii]|uniref:abortive infection family protein n=1 Tax=Actinomyces gaoshouyii TaxID=1960083 RepID=UPI000F7953FA|nr:abortive infection family protein [Actinomyces gaoshouyii]
MGDIDLATGGREALDEALERLRRSSDDPALAIGTAKDLLESVAKFVLEELGMGVRKGAPFNQLWHVAQERLGVLPKNVDTNLAGYKEIRQIHQSSWDIARNVSALRNLQGTGHGRTLPTGVSKELTWLVVREACSVAEYMLRLLDKEQGR